MISPSRKSGSRLLPLKKVLKRNPRFRDFGEDDIKYLWFFYKRGDFGEIGDLSPTDFRESIVEDIYSRYDHAWVLEFEKKPIGVIFAKNCGPFLLIRDKYWMETSLRVKFESLVKFFNVLRKKTLVMLYSNQKDKTLYEKIAKYGVISRVGTIKNMIEDENAPFYQTRWNDG